MRYTIQIIIQIITTITLLAIVVIANACTTSVATIPTILVKGADYNFEIPQEVPAGLVSFVFENTGTEAHHMQVVALNDGVTVEEVLAVLPQGSQALFPLLKGIDGGVGPLEPAGKGKVTVKLLPGNYLLLCFMSGHDGLPHLAKGMIKPFRVVGAMPDDLPEPTADATLKFVDFSFVLPQAIKAGEQVWAIHNQGTQPHELSLVKLAKGKSLDDFMRFSQNPHGAPPFINVGGLQAIDPGKSGWLHLDLTPGDYLALCHVPDPASGKSHSELGMMLPFHVKGDALD